MGIDWATVLPGATVGFDMTDAELVPEDTLEAFTNDEGVLNVRSLGATILRQTNKTFRVKTIENDEGVKEVYAICIAHNPQLAPKKKGRSRRRTTS